MNGYPPTAGETFEILNAGIVAGQFDVISSSGAYEMSCEQNRAVLRVLIPPSDITAPCGEGAALPAPDLYGGGLCGGGLGSVLPLLVLGLTTFRSNRRRSRR